MVEHTFEARDTVVRFYDWAQWYWCSRSTSPCEGARIGAYPIYHPAFVVKWISRESSKLELLVRFQPEAHSGRDRWYVSALIMHRIRFNSGVRHSLVAHW